MTRMCSLPVFAVLLSSILSPAWTKTAPNIVFILADDLGWDDVGFHGSDIQTPNIDRLAREGVILNNYYVQPMCTPTRGALLTGKYPTHLGLQHFVIVGSEPFGLPLTEVTLAQRLRDLGYSTHAVGKWHLGFYTRAHLPENRGFDSHLGYYQALGDYFNHSAAEGDFIGYDFHQNGQPLLNQTGYSTEIFTARAESIIRSHDQSKPLFLYLAHQAAHTGNDYDPLQVPQKYVDRFPHISDPRRRKYAGMVAALDDSVGSVYKSLEESGLLDKTLVIFSTDNGAPTNGMGPSPASNWPLRGSKNTLWQGGVRGAAFVTSELLKKRAYINPSLMHVSDWLPTLYNLAGGNLTDLGRLDGIDQLDVVLNNQTGQRTEVLLNIDPIDHTEALISGDYKIIKGQISEGKYNGWYSPESLQEQNSTPSDLPEQFKTPTSSSEPSSTPIAKNDKNVVVNCGPKPSNASTNCQPDKAACLFNLREDPCEYHNLATQLPQVVARLQARLDLYRDTMIPPGNKPSDPKGNPELHGGVWQPWL